MPATYNLRWKLFTQSDRDPEWVLLYRQAACLDDDQLLELARDCTAEAARNPRQMMLFSMEEAELSPTDR